MSHKEILELLRQKTGLPWKYDPDFLVFFTNIYELHEVDGKFFLDTLKRTSKRKPIFERATLDDIISYVNNAKENKQVLIYYTLHGNAQTSEVFQHLPLEDRLDFDLLGHNDTINKDYSLDILAEDVNKKIKHDCIIIGHSLGGHVAMRVAVLNKHVKGLVLNGTPPMDHIVGEYAPFIPNQKAYLFLNNLRNDDVKMDFIKECVNSELYVNELFRQSKTQDPSFNALLAVNMMKDQKDELELLREFNGPVLIIQGKDDKLINNKYIENKEIPNSTFVRIQGGHTTFLDNPNEFVNAIHLWRKTCKL